MLVISVTTVGTQWWFFKSGYDYIVCKNNDDTHCICFKYYFGSSVGFSSNPSQIYCGLGYPRLKNSMDREAWWATVHEIAKSQTQLSTHSYGLIKWLCTVINFGVLFCA